MLNNELRKSIIMAFRCITPNVSVCPGGAVVPLFMQSLSDFESVISVSLLCLALGPWEILGFRNHRAEDGSGI